MRKVYSFALVAIGALSMPLLSQAAPFTFGTGDYDNTPNTVTAGPTTHNNQTTGNFRDVIWWSLNNGAPRIGGPDFINAGKNLVLVGNSAVDNGTGAHDALNFTGPSVSGGQSYLTIYDTTPADGTATRNLFDASAGHVILSADVLFIKHSSSGGVVALYSEGQEGLALLASNADGANNDVPKVSLVFQSAGTGTTLTSLSLPANTFVANAWYRVTMDLSVSGDTWTMNGKFENHVTPGDADSAIGSLIANLNFVGSVSNPDGTALVLTNPGEVGLMAMGNEGINLPDNVGVSITNADFGTGVPEPASLGVLGLGCIGLLMRRRKA